MGITLSACGVRAHVGAADNRRRHRLHLTTGGLIDTTERRCEISTQRCIDLNLEDDGERGEEDGAVCSTDSDCESKFYGSN